MTSKGKRKVSMRSELSEHLAQSLPNHGKPPEDPEGSRLTSSSRKPVCQPHSQGRVRFETRPHLTVLSPQQTPENLFVPLPVSTSRDRLQPHHPGQCHRWLRCPGQSLRLGTAVCAQTPTCSPHLLALQVLVAVGAGRPQPWQQVGVANGDELPVEDKSKGGVHVASRGPSSHLLLEACPQTWPFLQKDPQHGATILFVGH